MYVCIYVRKVSAVVFAGSPVRVSNKLLVGLSRSETYRAEFQFKLKIPRCEKVGQLPRRVYVNARRKAEGNWSGRRSEFLGPKHED